LLGLIFREERLRFWSEPDIELKLAKNTGISVFRMGIDWSRIMPEEPVNGLKEIVSLVLIILTLIKWFCCILTPVGEIWIGSVDK
jgi:hypothetical protein